MINTFNFFCFQKVKAIPFHLAFEFHSNQFHQIFSKMKISITILFMAALAILTFGTIVEGRKKLFIDYCNHCLLPVFQIKLELKNVLLVLKNWKLCKWSFDVSFLFGKITQFKKWDLQLSQRNRTSNPHTYCNLRVKE